MAELRKYLADCENVKTGELFTFTFWSTHKADTKPNYEDAMRYWKRKHPKAKIAITQTLTDAYLYDARFYA